MNKFKIWWILKGEEKTKRIIGKICREILGIGIALIIMFLLVGSIVQFGFWRTIFVIGIVAVGIFIIYASIRWAD